MALTKITRGVIKANENYDTHNINSTGIVTAVSANFTGNVSIGGTLTYQDVTNIDSVGIVTAQSGLHVTSGSVGIGTANPESASQLHIKNTSGNAKITLETSESHDAYINFSGATAEASIGYEPTNNAVIISNSADGLTSNERFRIKSDGAAYFSGNLGLGGQTSPGAPIHLHNFGNDGYELKITGNAVQFNRSSNSYIDQLHNSGSILFRMTSSHTEAMRITSGGESKFTVGTNKYVKFYAATHNDEANLGAGLAFSRPSDGADMLSGIFAHSNTGLGIAARDHVTILTGGTSNVSDTEERLRIDSSGRVMIGTQTVGPTAGEQLTIADSANAGITIRSGTTAAGTILFEDDTADRGEIQYSHNGDYMRFKTGGSERARIDSDGHLQIRREGVGSVSGTDTRHTRYIIKQTNNQEAILGSVFAQGQSGWGGDLVFASKDANGNPSSGLTERFRINSGGFFNFNQANNNNLQGRVTIFDGGNFSTNSVLGSGDSDNIYLISDASSGYNVYGSSIAWSRVQYADRRVAAIANVQTSTDEDHVGLAFFTHPSADATAAIEEKFRITHDGIHITNGVSNFYVAFRLTNNVAYNWDIAVPNEGGYGNSFRCECGYNHYYTTSYGAHRSAWISSRGTSTNNMFDQDQSHSQSGYWTFSKPNNTTFRVTKTAGTYGGQGYGFIHVRFNYF